MSGIFANAILETRTQGAVGPIAEVLKRRAKALAQRPVMAVPGEMISVLEFQVAYERYGLDAKFIDEVCLLRHYTRLPCVPAYITGIMNLRGRVISIVDLKALFELPSKGLPYCNRVIVIEDGSMTLGLLADDIVGVRALPVETLQGALPTFTGRRLGYLKGITPDCAAVLDAEKLLGDKSLQVMEEVRRAPN